MVKVYFNSGMASAYTVTLEPNAMDNGGSRYSQSSQLCSIKLLDVVRRNKIANCEILVLLWINFKLIVLLYPVCYYF